MSRTKGTFSLTSNIEPKVGAPLDARTIVKLKTDLTASGTFDYPYKGLTVFVEEENKKYTLIGLDPTVSSNWMEESASGAAADITYDNTTSQLQSTNVQDAIDELNAKPAGVQSDWTEDDTSDLSYIKNKPENLVQDANYVHTDNNYDDTSKGKVDALGTASTKDVPASGNASTTQVVMGNDTRLFDARPASDVSSWAKASTKPTYTASEVGAIATTLKGVANGVAELDDAGKVPSSQLPSFVDDVIEVADYDHLPITGENGKIYVTLDTNKTYRWTGSGYAEISESLALGETSSTAYRGDRGKTAYDHATETKLSTDTASGLYKVASTAQGHIASLTAVTKDDITALGIPESDTNTKVTQTNSTTASDYRLLLSGSANDTTETTTAIKSTNFKANPSTGLLTVKQSKSTVDKSMLTGTGTAAQDKGSGVSPRYFPAKWTFNTGITVTDGDMFTIKIPVAGHSYGEFISVDNGTNYYPVGYNTNTLLTTHFPVGAIITVVFKADGVINSIYPVTGGDAKVNVSGGAFYVLDLYDSGNSNTYDRNRYQGAIKVWGTALVSGNVIVANTSGLYIHLKQNAAFDITYPILYLNEAVAANGTTTNTYDILNIATATTQSGTWTAYKPVFIKGQLSGTTFTPVSATPLTQTIPTTADGYEYILLGIATATTTVYLQERHPIYAYRNGKFGEIVNDADSVNGLTFSLVT